MTTIQTLSLGTTNSIKDYLINVISIISSVHISVRQSKFPLHGTCDKLKLEHGKEHLPFCHSS